jgi:dihydropyrimidinase
MRELDLAINGGTAVGVGGCTAASIGVRDGKIAVLAAEPLDAAEIVDATGKVVLPGGIDPHVHFRMYQHSAVTSDDYASGSASAACGGMTTYIDAVVQPTGGSAVVAVRERLAEACANSAIDFSFHAALTTATDATLAEIATLGALGVTSFQFFMTYRKLGFYTDLGFLFEAMREVARIGGVALIHAENDEILERLKARLLEENRTSIVNLADQRPDYAEEIAVAETAALAREAGCEAAVVQLSSARGLQAARRGRQDGARYWAETCPQYLLLSRELLLRPDAGLYTFTPTMKAPSDSRALWAGLANGEVTYLGSDHSPFDRSIKLADDSFESVCPGIGGTETLIPLMYSEGVGKGRLSLDRFAELTSGNAARIFQLEGKGRLSPGYDADLVVVDPTKDVTISHDILHSHCDYTAYEGFRVRGYPVPTASRGAIVMRDGAFVGRRGHGRFLARAGGPVGQADVADRAGRAGRAGAVV